MMPERNAWGLAFHPESIPPALKPYARWVIWMAAFTRPGKVDKHPRQARQPTKGASTKETAHWASFAEAVAAAAPPYSGVGYVLTQDAQVPTLPHLTALDLDHCRDVETGALNAQARAIVDSLKHTYWELSPSGTGLRAFFTGALPGASLSNHKAGVEIYNGDAARYVTVTGQHLPGTGADVAAVDAITLAALYEAFGDGTTAAQTVYAAMPDILPDDQASALTRTAADALPQRLANFLLDGVVEGYPSRSEATFAVCIALYGAGFGDLDVFSALHGSPHVWAMALEHRNQKEHRALAFLWRECCRARVRAAPQPLEFEDLTHAPETPTPIGPAVSPIFSPTVWQGQKARPREWVVEGYIPKSEVTLLMGGGGTGKSLSMLQLQTAMALNASWLGLTTKPGRSLGIYCEDKRDELHRRQEDLNRYYLCDHNELGDMLLWPRSTHDGALLMTFDNRDQGVRTKFATALVDALKQHRPELLILDTLADFFGGNENSRGQVTQFLRLLSHIAEKMHLAIVVCGHPSASGIQSGEGSSGSTAWSNAVRSRLYLHREKDAQGVELNPNIRILSKQKANYSTVGEPQRLAWVEGVFRYEREPAAEGFFASADEEAKLNFMALLRELAKAEKRVSTSKHGNYAPRVLAARMGGGAEAERRWIGRFEAAMTALLKAKSIEEIAGRPGHSAELVVVGP